MSSDASSSAPQNSGSAPPRRSRTRLILLVTGGIILTWLLVAYVVMPTFWIRRAHKHPDLADLPGRTMTETDVPGDPLNVSLIGTKAEIMKIMVAAKYYPADPLTLKSCLEIAEASVLKRPYDEAPVSNLFLWGRKEDLAFEQPVDNNPRQRHHVRYWKSEKVDADGRPIWVGATSYDQRVGLSHTTGEITHHIGPDLDAERGHLFEALQATGMLAETYFIDGFQKELKGTNGGGDPWFTDGRMEVGVIGGVKPS